MSIDRYTPTQNALKNDVEKTAELKNIRVFCRFFGGAACVELFVTLSPFPLPLIFTAALVEIAINRNGFTRSLFLQIAAFAAIIGELAQLVGMFVFKEPRFAGLIIGALLIWVSFTARKINRTVTVGK